MENTESKKCYEDYLINGKEVFFVNENCCYKTDRGQFVEIESIIKINYCIHQGTNSLLFKYLNDQGQWNLARNRYNNKPLFVEPGSYMVVSEISEKKEVNYKDKNARHLNCSKSQVNTTRKIKDYNVRKDEEKIHSTKPMQKQIQQTHQELSLAHKQIYANDLSGRLYAHIERLLKLSGSKLNPKYEAYLMKQEISKLGCLHNIEGYLDALSFFSKSSKIKRVANHNFVDDHHIFKNWENELSQLYRFNCINQTEYNVLDHAIKCCLEKRIKLLPERISESIMSTRATDEAASELIEHRLDDVVGMQYQTHKVAGFAQQIIEDADRRGEDITKFTLEPRIKYNPEDFKYKIGKEKMEIL